MGDNEYYARRHRLLLLAAVLAMEEESASRFRDLLDEEGRQRRDRRLPRDALLLPLESPWERLFASLNDQALITVTGFDHASFGSLLTLFSPWFLGHTPWTNSRKPFVALPVDERRSKRKGRGRMISDRACLGLTLAWYRFRGSEYILQGWFGLTGTPANVWLKFGRRGLLILLGDNGDAKVEMPDNEKVYELCRAVHERHDLLPDVYSVADGLKLYFQQCRDLDEQSMYYNGWQHDHFVSCVFVFSVDGRIIRCIVNAPGSLHDSTLAEWGGVYEVLQEVYERTGAKCCVDSAFATANNPFLLKSSQNAHEMEGPMAMLRNKQATSLRQAAEWGMRAIQSAFPRLRDRIKYELSGERRVFLALVPLLYNYRLSTVGLNQLQNTYVPSWSVDSNFFIN
jgi:DDE superfamily endonuclease